MSTTDHDDPFTYPDLADLTPIDVLTGAIDAIENYGWGQGDYAEPGTGEVCLVGAMACGGNHDQELALSALHSGYLTPLGIRGPLLEPADDDPRFQALTYLHRVIFGHSEFVIFDLTRWNDDPNRTRDEVVEALHDALDHARSHYDAHGHHGPCSRPNW